MKVNDSQLGTPATPYSNTKANIEALTGLTGGECAYSTDIGLYGYYNAISEVWVWIEPSHGGTQYFFEDTASDIGGYKLMTYPPLGGATAYVSDVAPADGNVIEEWATASGVPGIVFIPHGIWSVHLHGYKTGGGAAREVRLHANIYKRVLAGTETLLGTTGLSIELTDVEVDIPALNITIEDVILLATDRLVIKIVEDMAGSGAMPTSVTIGYNGTTSARLEIPISDMSSLYAPISKGVTNGDSHDHSGGDGAQIAYASLSGTPTVREVLTANRTYYVATTGSDSNDGLSSLTPFLTIQKAVDVVANIDIGIYDVDIQVADGTYTAQVFVNNPWIGSGIVTIIGNASTPANVLIHATSSNAITCQNGGSIYVESMQLRTTTSGHCLSALSNGRISISNIDFGTTSQRHINAQDGGIVTAHGNYSISGNAQYHWRNDTGSVIRIQSITITLTGTPNFSLSFSACLADAVQYVNSITFSGSATGKRYSVIMGGTIFTNNGGETYLPGDALGTKGSGGNYDDFGNLSRVSTQFDKTNTTLTNITGLTATLLAGRTYKFKTTLYTTSNVASGVKFAIAGTATTTAIIYEAIVTQGGAVQTITTSRATALGTAVGQITAVTVATCIIKGTITVNAAGTLTVQFADNAGTNTSSVLVGSTFEVTDIT